MYEAASVGMWVSLENAQKHCRLANSQKLSSVCSRGREHLWKLVNTTSGSEATESCAHRLSSALESFLVRRSVQVHEKVFEQVAKTAKGILPLAILVCHFKREKQVTDACSVNNINLFLY